MLKTLLYATSVLFLAHFFHCSPSVFFHMLIYPSLSFSSWLLEPRWWTVTEFTLPLPSNQDRDHGLNPYPLRKNGPFRIMVKQKQKKRDVPQNWQCIYYIRVLLVCSTFYIPVWKHSGGNVIHWSHHTTDLSMMKCFKWWITQITHNASNWRDSASHIIHAVCFGTMSIFRTEKKKTFFILA